MQQSSLAGALSEQKHTLIYFYSKACSLCKSISDSVKEEQNKRSENLNLAVICTDSQGFAPEILNYDVQAVPCLVLLEPKGSAIAKSGKPRSKDHIAAALDELLSLVPAQPLSQNKQQRKQQR